MTMGANTTVGVSRAIATRVAAECVARGIALLDEKGPAGWRDRINLAFLDVSDPNRCVVSQVFSGWPEGLTALNISSAHSSLYGFSCVGSIVCDCERLTVEWRSVLTTAKPVIARPRPLRLLQFT